MLGLLSLDLWPLEAFTFLKRFALWFHLPSTSSNLLLYSLGFAPSLWHVRLIGPESQARPLHETPGRMRLMALDDILNFILICFEMFQNWSKLLFHIPSWQPKLLWWSLVWWNIRLSAVLISLAAHPKKWLRCVEIIGDWCECQRESMWPLAVSACSPRTCTAAKTFEKSDVTAQHRNRS